MLKSRLVAATSDLINVRLNQRFAWTTQSGPINHRSSCLDCNVTYFIVLIAGDRLAFQQCLGGVVGQISHSEDRQQQGEAVAQRDPDRGAAQRRHDPIDGQCDPVGRRQRAGRAPRPARRIRARPIQASPQKVLRARSNLRAAASVDQEVAVYHTSNDKVPFIPVGTIYLSFKPDQSDQVKQRVLKKHGLVLVKAEPNGFLTVRVATPGTDAVEIAAKLQREKSVEVAEPDLVTTRRLRNLVPPDDALLNTSGI